jgi:hypothetical protein
VELTSELEKILSMSGRGENICVTVLVICKDKNVNVRGKRRMDQKGNQ